MGFCLGEKIISFCAGHETLKNLCEPFEFGYILVVG